METRIRLFFENNADLSHFKILDADGNPVEKYEGEASEIVDEVVSDVQTLEAGKYQIWASKAANGNSMTAKKLNITIGSASVTPLKKPKQMGYYSKEDIDNAYNQGVKDARINTLEKRMDMLEKRFEKLIEVVSDFKDEMDGTNDNDLLSKVMDGASKFKEVKDVLGDFS